MANRYRASKTIGPQSDLEGFEPIVLSLSFEQYTTMEFSRDGWVCALDLPRRILLVLIGEARYKWMHGILNDNDGRENEHPLLRIGQQQPWEYGNFLHPFTRTVEYLMRACGLPRGGTKGNYFA